MISGNLAAIREKIRLAAQKAGRQPGDIKLVCVTKNRPLEEIKEAIGSGITDIGENRVQEAREKHNSLAPIKWHLIGHLQTNKVKDAVGIFDLIHSVDSARLAAEIDKQAAKIGKAQDILIEAKTSGEESKFGIPPDRLTDLVKDIIAFKNIRLLGLMTMAPLSEDKELARPYFAKLRQLQGEVNAFLLNTQYPILNALSMGMSQDYEIAIEEGATMVRIGTAIFEG